MSVELVGFYGGDFEHAQAAWTSTSENAHLRADGIPKLLNFLACNNHSTPFERSLLHFRVDVDQPTAIHILKHRTIATNAESARYKEFRQDRWHTPEDWPQSLKDEFNARCEEQFAEYHDWLKYLESHGFSRTRAKESARYLLPLALVTTYDISMSFRAFVHFQGLRNSPIAQKEIREIAQQMLELVNTQTNDAFKWSLEAFGLTIPTLNQEAIQEGRSGGRG